MVRDLLRSMPYLQICIMTLSPPLPRVGPSLSLSLSLVVLTDLQPSI
jgi:hypothetical protein